MLCTKLSKLGSNNAGDEEEWYSRFFAIGELIKTISR